MPIVKRAIDRNPNAFGFDNVQILRLFVNGTVGAGVVNSAVQSVASTAPLPVACKIPILSFSCTSIDSLAGTDLFNVVVGTGAYSQGNPALGDNSDVSAAGTGQSPTGGLGYPTVFATTGQTLFAADQALTTTAGVGVAASTGQPALPTQTTTNGGVWRFVPTNYDAVYPAGSLLSLRLTTTAGTGSLNGVQVALCVVPVLTRGEIPYYTDVIVQPGVEF